MAVQIISYVTGTIKDVVYYKRLGKYVARARPLVVNQAPTTKIRSRNFGVAARAGKVLRSLISPAFQFTPDRNIPARLTGAIAKWLALTDPLHIPTTRSIPYVKGFRFNELASIAERWKSLFVTQETPGGIDVQMRTFIPVETLEAPALTTEIKCTLVVAVCNLANGEAVSSYNTEFSIPYTDVLHGSSTIALPAEIPGGCIAVVVAAFVCCFTDGSVAAEAEFMPCSIIHASFKKAANA